LELNVDQGIRSFPGALVCALEALFRDGKLPIMWGNRFARYNFFWLPLIPLRRTRFRHGSDEESYCSPGALRESEGALFEYLLRIRVFVNRALILQWSECTGLERARTRRHNATSTTAGAYEPAK